MTVSAELTRVTHNCNGSTTAFAFSFRIFNQEDIQVYLTNVNTGEETLLVLTTDYTVSGDFRFGGTVTTIATYSNIYTLTTIIKMALKQETDLIYAGTYSSETLERMSDRLTKIAQQLNERINRAFLFKTTSENSELLIPYLVANKYFVINSTGDGIELVTLAGMGAVSDEAYNADTWNNNQHAASKNALRDKVVSIDAAMANGAVNIATNTANIATNVTAIATNVTAIATKQQNLNDISAIDIGGSLSGNRNIVFDLVSDDNYPDYGLRIMKAAGANGETHFLHRGTGQILFKTSEVSDIVFSTHNIIRVSIDGTTGIVNFVADPTIDGNKIWHAGNDGAASGLGADKLDGSEKSYFQRKVVFEYIIYLQ